MRCGIWYDLYNLKNVKNTHEGVLLSVKFQAKAYVFLMLSRRMEVNPLSANPTKWSNTLKQFVDNFPTNCLSEFDHFVILELKGLINFLKLAQY